MKNFDNQNRDILQALKDVHILDKNNIRYLVMGSLLCVATRGFFYRRVGDVDIIGDVKDKEILKVLFEKLGYESKFEKPRRRLGFYWLDLTHKNNCHQNIAVVFGTFDKEGGWRLPLNKGLSLYLPPLAIRPSPYSIDDVHFVGIPRESAYIALTTMSMLYNDPKRKGDLEILTDNLENDVIEQIYKSGVGLWWRNYPLPNWLIIRLLAFGKNLVLGRMRSI